MLDLESLEHLELIWNIQKLRKLDLRALEALRAQKIMHVFDILKNYYFLCHFYNRERSFRRSFRIDLELIFCIGFLKQINLTEKIIPAQANVQNSQNFNF